jgi:hypothetical protein
MQVTRITWQLRYGIESSISRIYDKELDKINTAAIAHDVGDELYDYVVPAALKFELDKINAWIAKATQWRVICGDWTISIWLSSLRHVPPSYLELDPDTLPEHLKFTALYKKYVEISAEKQLMLDGLIKGLVDKCTNVAQLMRKWPTVLDYMDEVTLEKISKNSEANNKTKRKNLRDVSIPDDIKAKLIRLRMLNERNL